jgi:hypothetical protein
MYTAFCGSEQLKCANCSLANPGRQIGLFHNGDEFPDVPVSAFACTMIVMVEVIVMMLLGVLV